MPSQNSIAEYHLALTVQCELPPFGCSSPPGDPCKRRDDRGKRVPPQRATRRRAADRDRRAEAVRPRPDWCGECDEQTRLLDTDAGPKRCPTCHPLRNEKPDA